jgi:hypothetical protein
MVQYEDQKLRTRKLQSTLRSLAWDRHDQYLIVVGNSGRVQRIRGEEQVFLDPGTKHNMRGVSVNPTDGMALIVGNAGTVLLLDENDCFNKVTAPTFENLRAVSWDPKGTTALIAGNNGTLLKYAGGGVELIDDGRANLRDISWRPPSDEALITSNCFAEEFIPSPNLFRYDAKRNVVKPLNEGRADLLGVDWNPTGETALVVGYDVVWHNGLIGIFEGTTLAPIQFENKRVYPVAVAWAPSDDLAAIATATAQPGMGQGAVYLWDGKKMTPIYTNDEFFFSDVVWSRKAKKLAAVASTSTRTFNS